MILSFTPSYNKEDFLNKKKIYMIMYSNKLFFASFRLNLSNEELLFKGSEEKKVLFNIEVNESITYN